jgi:dTDP-4-amino-4,6-dideoxygalactose transaminase
MLWSIKQAKATGGRLRGLREPAMRGKGMTTSDSRIAPISVLRPLLPDADALLPYLRRIDQTRLYSNFGPLASEFALRLSALTGAASVTLTSSGTTAIEIALRAATSGCGTCLMPSFTFIASAHAVCNAGMRPHLLDVDPNNLVLTPDIALAALPTLPERPAAVLVVSAFGAPPDLSAWARFEAEEGIPVVFDAAAAATALSGVGRSPVCVSLHATKVLGIGEGGAVLTSDTVLGERLTAMTGFGFCGPSRVAQIQGGNYRLSEYAAAVGLAAIEVLPERLAMLRSLALGYRDRLLNRRTRLQHGAGEAWQTMTLNVILPEDKVEDTTARLDAAGVQWRRWWGFGIHHHPAFADLPRSSLAATKAVAPRVIGIPFHVSLTEAELDRVAALLP